MPVVSLRSRHCVPPAVWWTAITLPIAGCSHSPTLNLLGSYFPAWMLCAVVGIVASVIVRQILNQGEIPTTRAGCAQLIGDHALPGGTPVARETGTVAFFVARELTALGLVPSVIDAHEVRLKAYRPRQQCDRRDAHELGESLRRDIYRTRVHVPPLPIARLRETLSRRRHFVRLQTAEVNAVKRLLRGTGRGTLSRSLGTEVGWAKLLGAVAGEPELQQRNWAGACRS